MHGDNHVAQLPLTDGCTLQVCNVHCFVFCQRAK
jgi:hypothetical protein